MTMTQPSTDIAAPVKDTGGPGPRVDSAPIGAEKPLRVQNASALSAPGAPPPAVATSQGAAPAVSIVDPPAAAPKAADATSAIESLDAQLAELTAELLNKGTGVAPQPQAAVPATIAAPPKPVEAPVAPKETAAPVVAPAPAAPAAHAAIAPTPTPSPAPAPAPATPAPKPVQNREVKPPSALLTRMAWLSKPVAGKPRAVRVAVGVLGINTLILAGGVWAYLMMRTPPTASVEGYDFAASSLPMAPVKKEEPPPSTGHKASSGAHEPATKPSTKPGAKTTAKTDKKAPDKKAPEKKGAAKEPAKADEHGHE
jgi:hypothetical protein